MARLQKEKQAAVTTGLAEQPAFPARWVERLLRALPGDRACLPPSSGCRRPRHQRRGVGTTRLDRPLGVRSSARETRTATPGGHRISRSTVRDDRETPLQRAGDGKEHRSDLPDDTRSDLPDGMRQTGTTGSLGMAGCATKTVCLDLLYRGHCPQYSDKQYRIMRASAAPRSPSSLKHLRPDPKTKSTNSTKVFDWDLDANISCS